MSHGAGSGDKLARGAVKAQFMTTEGGISQDKWAAAFDDFDAEKFKNDAIKERSGDASGETPGILGIGVGETQSDEPITR